MVRYAAEANSRRDGDGAMVPDPAQFWCDGNATLDRSASVVVPVTCSNGLKGEAVVAIQLDRRSGTHSSAERRPARSSVRQSVVRKGLRRWRRVKTSRVLKKRLP